MTNLLEQIAKNPAFLKTLSVASLETVCAEIRERIIAVVSKCGGHLASNLGVVELTVALHTVFDIPQDTIIFDVGHQVYPHKLLTGRDKRFEQLRCRGGLLGFPSPEESDADPFLTGHAGTAVSSGLGLKTAFDMKGETSRRVAVVLGDGSLTNGLTFEGLNSVGSLRKPLFLVLNDNNFSISGTKGALSYYLAKLSTSPRILRSKEELEELFSRIPRVGSQIVKAGKDLEKRAKYLLATGFFEKMGLDYFGPVNGHDVGQLIEVMKHLANREEPVLLHVITKKGKGYSPAEENPERFHSTGPFDIKSGKSHTSGGVSEWVGEKLVEMATETPFVLITSAMTSGLGFSSFSHLFPDRFFDVGIAESHSLVFSGGLAKAGVRVYVGIYSTFLQRAYDELFHDIALQGFPVVLLIDRAGIVSADGPTHQGIYDISFLRTIPNIEIYSPYSLENLQDILTHSLETSVPMAIRYPKAILPQTLVEREGPGTGEILLLALGSCAEPARMAAQQCREEGLSVAFRAISRIKPFDENAVKELSSFRTIVTIEEHTLPGGFGSSVLEYCSMRKIKTDVVCRGIPDGFVEMGRRDELLSHYGLDTQGIYQLLTTMVHHD